MENKLRQLKSLADIVDTMIKGLKKEWVKVDMASYGYSEKGVCFGCAATNTLCELTQESFTEYNIEEDARGKALFITYAELDSFERAINELRQGHADFFLSHLYDIGHLLSFSLPNIMAIEYNKHLPLLTTITYNDYLHHYEDYRDFLISKGL